MKHDPLCDQHQQEALDNAGGWDYGTPCICPLINQARDEYYQKYIDAGWEIAYLTERIEHLEHRLNIHNEPETREW